MVVFESYKRLKPTYTALLVSRLYATLAQNNQLRSGGLAERYMHGKEFLGCSVI